MTTQPLASGLGWGMAEWASALVGRREELGAFRRALDDARGGSSRVVAVRGEPGIGKSRLLAEVDALARDRGVLVTAGRAAELERDLTFALLVDSGAAGGRPGAGGADRGAGALAAR
jgi:AAA ATPase domain